MKIRAEVFEWFDARKCLTKLKESQTGWEEREKL
jgi:hypothetical protein